MESLLGTPRSEAARYLLARQSANGGFCFYRSAYIDEPNLQDTFHAISALSALGAEIPCTDQLIDYIYATPPSGLDNLYFSLRTLNLLQKPAQPTGLQQEAVRTLKLGMPDTDSNVRTSDWFAIILKTIRLKKQLGMLLSAAPLVSRILEMRRGGGFGDKPNLSDTAMALTILNLLGETKLPDDIREFVALKQLPAYGFILTDDSRMTNLDVLHDGVRCCQLLSIPVRYAEQILRFVLACQNANGGFARMPDAAPSIVLTDRAVQILLQLASTPMCRKTS